MPPGGPGEERALIWLRGKYNLYAGCDQEIVAVMQRDRAVEWVREHSAGPVALSSREEARSRFRPSGHLFGAATKPPNPGKTTAFLVALEECDAH